MDAKSVISWEAKFVVAYLVFLLVFALAWYIINSIFMMRLFAKANVSAWKAWVPFVNSWKFLELGGFSGAWIFLAFTGIGAPILYVINCIAAYNIGLKLRKEGVWVVLYIFIQIVWVAICGLDKSTWDDSLGQPARGPEVPPSSRNAGNPPNAQGIA